jgi:Leucine-rich repeat (LRR) protein
MKKLYFLFVTAFIGCISNAQIINIPDANFKTRLLQSSTTSSIAKDNFGASIKIDTNNDNEIQVSEALLVYRLTVSYAAIADLTGLGSFTNLKQLFCENNQLTSLNVSPLTQLELLNCQNNQVLTGALDVSMLPSLKELNCNNNSLTSLNVNGLINLENLYCGQNNLSNLNVASLVHLKYLACSDNQLTSLEVNNLTTLEKLYFDYNNLPNVAINNLINLTELSCAGNEIQAIDLSPFSQLIVLQCNGNLLTSLDLSNLNNLQVLNCAVNPLTALDVSNLTELLYLQFEYSQIHTIDLTNLANLNELYCNDSGMTSLDLTHNPNIYTLFCQNNSLTSLDISNALYSVDLNCSSNLLSTLNLKNGNTDTFILSNNPNLEYICADDAETPDVQDAITSDLPNCHVNSYCTFTPGGDYYTIEGKNREDSNHNGCDLNDIAYPNLKLQFSNGTATADLIPDASGNYHYDVQAGAYTVTPLLGEAAAYYSVTPESATVSFPNTANSVVQDFCITSNGPYNDLDIMMIPVSNARPGFDATYLVRYRNKGTTTQNGSFTINFDDAVLDFVSASIMPDNQNPNNLNWNFTNLQPFEYQQLFLTLNVNSPLETPAVNDGDGLLFMTTIVAADDETPADNTSIFYQLVVNSLDPNDKTCLEGPTISPSAVGTDVHYVIRFENTGTANAENIVVKDMIDTTKYDINSLVPMSGSAAFSTRITNTNQVEFVFENINLPFDDAHNDGYVAFKIKTKPTLVVGDSFSNTANIYFDYNAPIVTNTATTTVQVLGNTDFNFTNAFTLAPVPTKSTLTLTANQKSTISSISIYNALGQVVQVITNPNETIDVSDLKTGSYFIKIVSDKGTANGKFIKE